MRRHRRRGGEVVFVPEDGWQEQALGGVAVAEPPSTEPLSEASDDTVTREEVPQVFRELVDENDGELLAAFEVKPTSSESSAAAPAPTVPRPPVVEPVEDAPRPVSAPRRRRRSSPADGFSRTHAVAFGAGVVLIGAAALSGTSEPGPAVAELGTVSAALAAPVADAQRVAAAGARRAELLQRRREAQRRRVAAVRRARAATRRAAARSSVSVARVQVAPAPRVAVAAAVRPPSPVRAPRAPAPASSASTAAQEFRP